MTAPMRDALGALVHEFLAREQAHAATLWLIGRGVLEIRPAENGISRAWHGPQPTQAVQENMARLACGVPAEDSVRVELPWGPTSVGVLHIIWTNTVAGSMLARFARCVGLARECALLVKRHEVRAWSQRRFGHPLLMGGMSRAWRDVESFIERAAWAQSPVLLRGPFGTEKPLVAAAIHATGPQPDKAFIEVTCSVLDEAEIVTNLPRWFAAAGDGTLFINGLDEVSLPAQQALLHLLGSRVGQWLARADAASSPRLIAAVNTGERESIYRPLMAELDVLTVALPSLRERAQDIPWLVRGVLERQGFSAELKMTEALLAFCEHYEWPEHRFELERMITRLAVMTHDRAIEADDIRAYIRELNDVPVTDFIRPSPVAQTGPERGQEPDIDEPTPAQVASGTHSGQDARPETGAKWARQVVAEDLTDIENLHEGVQRTLRFLLGHYHEQITLGQVARQVGVSPSHLTYLFKCQLGLTFKPFVHQLRIERAKQLLESHMQMRITDIAFEVGFNDLRHFERLFRRIVAMTPSEYRARFR